jgi:hypothetical protein
VRPACVFQFSQERKAQKAVEPHKKYYVGRVCGHVRGLCDSLGPQHGHYRHMVKRWQHLFTALRSDGSNILTHGQCALLLNRLTYTDSNRNEGYFK